MKQLAEYRIQVWPIHELQWKREIAVTTFAEDLERIS